MREPTPDLWSEPRRTEGDELFWNLTNGHRIPEPVPGLYLDVCRGLGRHITDPFYGPNVCARCGERRPRRRLLARLRREGSAS